ncbi:putative bifunctional diguanylate cyclase/phosphodiesterase [Alishewanella longhuensis]
MPNRLSLLEKIAIVQQQVAVAGLLMINIDRMKFINDARGYNYGNLVIQRFAERLGYLSPHFLGHLGADSFYILLTAEEGQALPALCQQLAERVLLASKQPLMVLDDALVISCSIGISIVVKPIMGEELLQRAETAMHIAKRQGGNKLSFYSDVDGKKALLMFQTEKALRLGLAHNELRLYLQSQCNEQGQLAGAEALVRWQHPSEGLISPGLFIPVAERSDLIIALDNWVLQQSCQLLAEWQQQGRKLTLSVNISPRHVRHADFVTDITRLLEQYQLDASALVLEVTEGILVEDIAASIQKMQTLAALGVQFAIDDFGTGYSSLSYIRNLPVQELKIDQSFIKGIPQHANDVAMVTTIISVARQLGLRLVAEGVETAEQNAFCQREGLWAQGYYIDKPLPVSEWQQRWFNA